MLEKMARLAREEEGQGMAEYGLILAGVAVVAAGIFVSLGGKIEGLIQSVMSKL
ncbi:Flp family type IVb pilin [Pseudalkalibacillus hwajinpoensis]|uniref:Flp family type IVb pilin n=1 Tax=Guptibacillus hwajinpoensis TaxID=208199 RepID=A0A4U1MN41_9BACL|nr:Flp family type IVb pilin [Pseudalkalibacillus hwajinpoensis]TKD72136.1 Flp family type IVb pilin [Pseudalkalibacillus hwajinpoensis]